MMFLEDIKKELRPKDFFFNKVDEFIIRINSALKKSGLKAKCVKGGSTAKDTFLKDDHDIDLFVIFDYSYKEKDISKLLYNSIKSIKPEIIHGSRDYFQYKQDNLNFEIVPVLEVKDPEKIENVTDMSPHHVKWANSKLNDKLRDDIRLAKKFCKAQKIYGAESYISGFSGHVIDILTIYYGGFLELLKAAKDWNSKVVIDIEKKVNDPLKELDMQKTISPLILIDPVQPNRNAAAALSVEKFVKFKETAKIFLEKPSKEFFEEKEFNVKEIKQKYKDNPVISLKIKTKEGKKDIVGAKTLKVYEFIKKQLMLNDFTVIDSDWKWDKRTFAEMYFVIKEKELSETFIRAGPPIKQKDACIAFKEKNSHVFEKDKKLYATVKRTFRKPKSLIEHLIKEDNVTKKIEHIKLN